MLGSALCKACSCRAKSAVPFECAVRDNEIDEIGRDDQIARPRCRWPSGSIRFLTSSPVSCRKAVADLRPPIPGRDRMLATIPARRSAWTENIQAAYAGSEENREPLWLTTVEQDASAFLEPARWQVSS